MARSDSELLDRLVRRAVLAVAHGVVREDEDGRQLHQGREPDGRPRVVAEDEEGRAERPQLRERQAVHDRAPWRARGCRSAGSCRRGCRAGSRRRRRRSAWSCSTARGRPSRRGTRECSAPARSAPCPRRRVRRCPWRRPGRPAGCGPSRRAARAAASGRSRSASSGILRRGSRRTASSHARARSRAARADAGVEVLADAVGHQELARPPASRRRAW